MYTRFRVVINSIGGRVHSIFRSWIKETHLTSSVSVSSPLVQTTASSSDSITSLASHLSFRALPAFRCLSLGTTRPESSVIVNSGAENIKHVSSDKRYLGTPSRVADKENFTFREDIKQKHSGVSITRNSDKNAPSPVLGIKDPGRSTIMRGHGWITFAVKCIHN